MGDYLLRATAKEAGVRALVGVTTEMVQEGARRHGTEPTATAVLGHGLTGAALFGALLKVQQRVAIKYEGSGPISKMVVESDAYGKVRGYVSNPHVSLPRVDEEMDVRGALGNVGLLTVVKDLRLKELAESVVPTAGGALDEELTFYLNQSEQIPSFVATGVYFNDEDALTVAGGLLLQAIPPYDEAIIHRLSGRLQEMPPLATMLHHNVTPEKLLADLFDGIAYDVLENRPLRFKCSCSRERTEQALLLLGRVELEHLLATEGQAIVDCHFCHEQYVFDKTELEGIISSEPRSESNG